MEKVIIYTNEVCPYCKQIKEKLTEKKIGFENRLTTNFKEEWQDIISLTGMSMVPTVFYKNNYFIPGRDYGNPDGLVAVLENFEESSFSDSRRNLELLKSLNANMIQAFQRVDQLLRQIETKTNKEDEHKSTN